MIQLILPLWERRGIDIIQSIQPGIQGPFTGDDSPYRAYRQKGSPKLAKLSKRCQMVPNIQEAHHATPFLDGTASWDLRWVAIGPLGWWWHAKRLE